MVEQTDAELIVRCLNGSREAFGVLVDRYQRIVFNLALRMVRSYDDAEEIAQTVFVKAFEKIASFNPEHRFFSWIYRMTINESINHLKRARARVPLSESQPFEGKSAEAVVYTTEVVLSWMRPCQHCRLSTEPSWYSDTSESFLTVSCLRPC